MSHFAGFHLLDSQAVASALNSKLLRQAVERLEWKGHFVDGSRFGVVHVDFTRVGGEGLLQIPSPPTAAALAGDLILEEGGRERFSRLADLERLAAAGDDDLPNVLALANGTFAVCCYKPDADSLVLATDSLGARPLYYTVVAGILWFSTSFRFLLKASPVPRRVDLDALAEQYAFWHPLRDRTLLKDIKVLRDGEYLCVRRGKWSVGRYKRWEDEPQADVDWEAHIDSCHDAFTRALRSRAGESSLVTSLLSGGLDSRCVVAGLLGLGKKVHAVNCSLPGTQDFEYAKRFAQSVGVSLTHIPWSPAQLDITDGKTVAKFHQSALSTSRERAVFSGDGGGETFGFLLMAPNVMNLLGQGQIHEAISAYTRGRNIPVGMFARKLQPRLQSHAERAMSAEFAEMHALHPQKALQHFLLRNELRRHLHEAYEEQGRTQAELLLPFFDKRVLSAVLRIPAPLDRYLSHRFYDKWMARLRPSTLAVPWQTYPVNDSCPIAEVDPPETQWQMVRGLDGTIARRWALQALRATLRRDFPSQVLRRRHLQVAAFTTLSHVADASHRVKAGLTVLDALSLGTFSDELPTP